jgi:SPP1 gp7 family putative phage head morphogenesis protein
MAFTLAQTLQSLNPFRNIGKQKGKESIRNRMMQVQVHRIRQDVGRWRAALDQAENVYFPNRTDLLNIYADLVLDNHLSSVMETRLINVLSRPFKLQNEAGEEQPKATRLLKKPWFRKFCYLALEKIYYGHSLIEFPLPEKGEFKDCDLIPRQYVSPELGIVRTMPGMITGTDFRNDAQFAPWLIEVGDATDLGLLNKVAPMALYKKNVMSAWADFTEVFGMPYRAVKTDAEGDDLDKIEDMIANMGQASWGVFPEDVKIDFISAATANERLYDTFINRANSEMSKAVLGQTMTTDDGSSKAQGEVHERVAANYTRADSEFLLSLINEQLLPFLQSHGYQVQGLEFAWDESEQLSKPELFKIVQGVMTASGYKLSRAWLESTFGIELEPEAKVATGADGAPAAEPPPILGYHIESGVVDRNEARLRLQLPEQDESEAIAQRKLKGQLSVLGAATTAGIPLEAALQLAGISIALPPAPEGPGDDGDGGPGGPGGSGPGGNLPGKPEGPAAAEQRGPAADLTALYAGHCCSTGSPVAQLQASAADDKALQALIERLIAAIYAGAADDEIVLADLPLFELITEQLSQAIEVAWNSPDVKLKGYLKKNVQRFSGFKSARVCREMTQKLYDAEGKIRDFAAFKADALQVNQLYNVHYLKTEYEQAVAGAQMASKWSTFEPTDMLQYRTVGDDLVRPEHRKWDGVTLPASHAWWQTHYPPNDWNCRCDVVDLVDDDAEHTSAEELAGLPDVPKMFATNVGKAGEVFSKEHPYFDVPAAEKKKIEQQLKLDL